MKWRITRRYHEGRELHTTGRPVVVDEIHMANGDAVAVNYGSGQRIIPTLFDAHVSRLIGTFVHITGHERRSKDGMRVDYQQWTCTPIPDEDTE